MENGQRMIEALILSGALEVAAFDTDSNELVYSVTEKMEEVAPELYESINNQIYQVIMSLWQKGFLSMDITSESPMVSLSRWGLDENNWKVLSEVEQNVMKSVMRMHRGEI